MPVLSSFLLTRLSLSPSMSPRPLMCMSIGPMLLWTFHTHMLVESLSLSQTHHYTMTLSLSRALTLSLSLSRFLCLSISVSLSLSHAHTHALSRFQNHPLTFTHSPTHPHPFTGDLSLRLVSPHGTESELIAPLNYDLV